jgi:hypothetical protein
MFNLIRKFFFVVLGFELGLTLAMQVLYHSSHQPLNQKILERKSTIKMTQDKA